MYHYIIISLYHYNFVSLYHCITVSLYLCIIISLYHCIIISLYHYITIPYHIIYCHVSNRSLSKRIKYSRRCHHFVTQRGELTGEITGEVTPLQSSCHQPKFRKGVKGIRSCETGPNCNDSEPLQALS